MNFLTRFRWTMRTPAKFSKMCIASILRTRPIYNPFSTNLLTLILTAYSNIAQRMKTLFKTIALLLLLSCPAWAQEDSDGDDVQQRSQNATIRERIQAA